MPSAPGLRLIRLAALKRAAVSSSLTMRYALMNEVAHCPRELSTLVCQYALPSSALDDDVLPSHLPLILRMCASRQYGVAHLSQEVMRKVEAVAATKLPASIVSVRVGLFPFSIGASSCLWWPTSWLLPACLPAVLHTVRAQLAACSRNPHIAEHELYALLSGDWMDPVGGPLLHASHILCALLTRVRHGATLPADHVFHVPAALVATVVAHARAVTIEYGAVGARFERMLTALAEGDSGAGAAPSAAALAYAAALEDDPFSVLMGWHDAAVALRTQSEQAEEDDEAVHSGSSVAAPPTSAPSLHADGRSSSSGGAQPARKFMRVKRRRG
jgi:hypothetical protein